MRPFGYDRPVDRGQAVATVSGSPGARYLAGGTNLVDLMRLGVAAPDLLVDVSAVLPGAVQEQPDGGLLIGAGTPNSDLAADERIRRSYPVLSQALLAGASGQLRNLATVGGNLLQRTRCVYFTDVTKPCNKREPGSGCPARTGSHRDLAVLGASESCIATHPSDMAVALAALDARVHVSGSDGDRVLEMDDFYRLPGDDPSRDTTLRHGDLVTTVELPAGSACTRRSAYRKARDRASYAFALGSVAVALDLSGGTVRDVRIAFGALAHRPWR
ncbi:MAG: xanthine dehydrogenase family protein subunit M, partial [Actinomycetota bacterium]|nr:xanthine dehydrogenase family protein subunit M [Actinomycetota bacterium]